jgi:hypothetical protein
MIKASVRKTKFTKTASISESTIKKAFMEKDPILETLKTINIALYFKSRFHTEDADIIISRIAELLGLSEPKQLEIILKEASNQNALALTNHMSQFIHQVQINIDRTDDRIDNDKDKDTKLW